jgi:hypothetical protein
MLKKVALLAAFVSIASAAPAYAEDGDSPWADATTGTMQGNATYQTDQVPPYVHENQGRLVPGEYRKSSITKGLGQDSPIKDFANNGGPIIIFGVNTFLAPANLALQTQSRSGFGGRLPETHIDSFVAQAMKSGNAEMIYGDEGTHGPPPLSNFNYIQSGGVSATTGHQSDAPSAWGTPLKYNSAGGVIQGQ